MPTNDDFDAGLDLNDNPFNTDLYRGIKCSDESGESSEYVRMICNVGGKIRTYGIWVQYETW